MEYSAKDYIIIKGAKENNLQNIDLVIPKNQFVVITGISGSGKSSLAFDTIYAEGQRRYLTSLSAYMRQFLGNNEKPDVDAIEGLSPTIAIDQKTTSHNPRSTVGTVTEIYDYFRLLYARIGKPFCPQGHGKISTLSISQITQEILALTPNCALKILAPMVQASKGSFQKELVNWKQLGYLRVWIDNQIYSLDEPPQLLKNQKHTIALVIDRFRLNLEKDLTNRVYAAVEKAVQLTKGQVLVLQDNTPRYYNQNYACNICAFSLPQLEPRFFSFNSPMGACEACNGLGVAYEPDPLKIAPDHNYSIANGGLAYFKNGIENPSLELQKQLALWRFYRIDPYQPLKNHSQEQWQRILYGSDQMIKYQLVHADMQKRSYCEPIVGLVPLIKKRYYETTSPTAREYYSQFMSDIICSQCNGQRLAAKPLCVQINGVNIMALCHKSVDELLFFFQNLTLSIQEETIAALVLKEITNRLRFLQNVGLHYLTLARNASTLSGGESQRIRLASQIGSGLTGVLYVLDEPSIGLHQKDNIKLIATLQKMKALGNTLIVVEHDEETMWACDYLIDIGPKAGLEGGKVVGFGSAYELAQNTASITGQYLAKKRQIPIPLNRRKGNGKVLKLFGACGNNLQKINVTFPLNTLIAITGVSGSGKSTLINQTLIKGLQKHLINPFITPAPYTFIEGVEHVDKVVLVTQEPIGRTPRSNPATYVGVFDDIRALFANLPQARALGYQKGRFSFNVKGGRCEFCSGEGNLKISMHFLPDVYIQCQECLGTKYNQATLQIHYRNHTIADVLNFNINQALAFFETIPAIKRKLSLLVQVGLGYLKLGTSALVLSGGEAQRLKLAKFLQKKATGKTLYVLDEPTTGLHFYDIAKLIQVLQAIVSKGDSVIVIEHNLDLIKTADYVIDLGPEGGDGGGKVVAFGTPEDLAAQHQNSYTGQFLAQIFQKQKK